MDQIFHPIQIIVIVQRYIKNTFIAMLFVTLDDNRPLYNNDLTNLH